MNELHVTMLVILTLFVTCKPPIARCFFNDHINTSGLETYHGRIGPNKPIAENFETLISLERQVKF